VIRLQAGVDIQSSEYRGPILFNPGGPGGSGVELVLNRGRRLASVLGPQFDIVGFDPRGKYQSQDLCCTVIHSLLFDN
jgi:pimeloyl-ACP methyl ester carboxylesterase